VRSISGPALLALIVSIVVLFALDSWAWRARRPDISGAWRFRRDRMFHADLYTDEGNRRRRVVVAWFALTMSIGVVAWLTMLATVS
jgi:hypothetical protein